MNGDITVFGLQMPTCLIEDIGMDIPHGTVVVVPGVKAAKSKDLWRSISQKLIWQLHYGSGPTRPVAQSEMDQLQQQNGVLTARVVQLQTENAELRAKLANPPPNPPMDEGKLDTILALLQARPSVEGRAVVALVAPVGEVVDGAVPTFFPSVIKPEGLGTHVETATETSEGSQVSGAAGALRRHRQGK